jgi:hypothetical protein
MNPTKLADLLTNLTLTKELKAQITSKYSPANTPLPTHHSAAQARALYSRHHSPGHAFEVIISRKDRDSIVEYEALLILYPAGAQYGEWIELLRNTHLCQSPVDAMTDLLEEAYVRVGEVVEGS